MQYLGANRFAGLRIKEVEGFAFRTELFHAGQLFATVFPSFPLDRSRGLRSDVVDDAIDALDLVDDARRHRADEAHVERIEIRGHAVGRGHRAYATTTVDVRWSRVTPENAAIRNDPRSALAPRLLPPHPASLE